MVSSPHIRSPPRSPVPPRSCSSPSVSASSPALLTPLQRDYRKSPRSINSSTSVNTARMEQSPLKVAASLIQSLDIAHTEMTSFAADAAADAEIARQNARTAQEIIRRYQNRSYPSFKLEKFEAESAATPVSPSSSVIKTSRSKRQEFRRFHRLSPRAKVTINGFKQQNDDEEKEYRSDGDQGNKKNKEGDIDTKTLSAPQSPIPYSRGKNLLAPQSPTTYQRSKSRLAPQSPTSYERIAQHHADDLLQLSLELEQTKQALKSEQRLHKECQSSLESMKEKKKKAEKNNQKLVLKHGMERKESMTQISNLERELEVSRLRLEAAEEDAQLALDLAKDSAEQRDEMEESLLELRKEIEILRDQQHQDGKPQSVMTTPKRFVHFADTDASANLNASANANTDNSTNTSTSTPALLKEKGKASPLFYTPRENGPPRAMIAAGRQLLLRRNMTPQDVVIRLEASPARSAERRQQLCQRLNEHLNESSSNEDTNIALLSSSPSRTPLSPTPGRNNSTAFGDAPASLITKKKLEEYHTAMKILQISGKRLGLDGYCWREQSSKTMPSNNNPIQIDITARQYCQNVEVRIV